VGGPAAWKLLNDTSRGLVEIGDQHRATRPMRALGRDCSTDAPGVADYQDRCLPTIA
jgi:hypothetical protein